MTSIERFLLALLALGAATSSPAILYAQGLTGQISGTVLDSGGGVVPGASVTIQNAGTLLIRHATTGMEGTFVFPDLLAGTYDVKVALEGFKTAEHNAGVELPGRVRAQFGCQVPLALALVLGLGAIVAGTLASKLVISRFGERANQLAPEVTRALISVAPADRLQANGVAGQRPPPAQGDRDDPGAELGRGTQAESADEVR